MNKAELDKAGDKERQVEVSATVDRDQKGVTGPSSQNNPTGQTGGSAPGEHQVPEEDLMRAAVYALLARLLAQPMDDETIAFVRGLSGDDSELGQAIDTLAGLATRSTQVAAEDEFTVLFYGFGAGGELAPFASQYLTGFVYEKPLADLREDLQALGIERQEGVTDPEDHMAFICEVMHGLITGSFGEPADLAAQRAFFEKHLAPWASHFFTDMEQAKNAAVYMPLGTIGRVFMDIEKEAFGFGQ